MRKEKGFLGIQKDVPTTKWEGEYLVAREKNDNNAWAIIYIGLILLIMIGASVASKMIEQECSMTITGATVEPENHEGYKNLYLDNSTVQLKGSCFLITSLASKMK